MDDPAFACKRCGHCCQGEGGIILTENDRARLAEHLGLTVAAMLEEYAENAGDKLHLRVGGDKFCVFFRQGVGCGVHDGRPDICRAWPYFRGNLVDPVSWELVQTDCPGIDNAAGHEAFVREGLDYLHEHKLIHEPGPESPGALVLTEALKKRLRK